MLPKTRKNLRDGLRIDVEYPSVIALALAKEVGRSRHAVKTLTRWTGASERTVQNWLSGVRGPSGPHLIALSKHSAAVHWAYLSMSDRMDTPGPHVRASVALLKEALELLSRMSS